MQPLDEGKYSGSTYCTRRDIRDISEKASALFLFTNIQFYARHQRSKQLEMEIVSMCLRMFKAPDSGCGLTTYGGSESIMLAILAHKRLFEQEKGITKPEIIFPETAHASFWKACEFFGIVPRVIDVDRKTGLCSIGQYRELINKNTILLVASCPNVAFGLIDPVAELDDLAGEFKVGLFLDCCLGGFLGPFCEDFNYTYGEVCNFEHKNVTSMCCDPHKYGLSPKGCSVLLFSNIELQKALYFGKTDWCGYLYGTATFLGSKGASLIAASWAVMMYNGRQGYTNSTKGIIEGRENVANKINAIEELEVIGEPKLGNMAFRSLDKSVNIFYLANYMATRGWKLVPTPKYQTIRVLVHPNNLPHLDQLCSFIKEGVK